MSKKLETLVCNRLVEKTYAIYLLDVKRLICYTTQSRKTSTVLLKVCFSSVKHIMSLVSRNGTVKIYAHSYLHFTAKKGATCWSVDAEARPITVTRK